MTMDDKTVTETTNTAVDVDAPAPPALSVRDLRFAYAREARTDRPLIDVGDLTLARNEQLLVTGASGCGKSTLLHLIAGLLEPQAGRIEVDGRDLVAMPAAKRDAWRGRRIGMIFQTFNLIHGFSALENVMLAMVVSHVPPAKHRDRAERLLHDLGLETIDSDPERMSVGQKQRVAVARALAAEPVLVLADEPTASLDPEHARVAMDLIQDACRRHGAALVCTSHDPALPERFERRATLDDLRGTPA